MTVEPRYRLADAPGSGRPVFPDPDGRPSVTVVTGAEGQVDPDPLGRYGARPLSEISDDPPAPLLIDRLDPEGHTILYGTGGVGKGVLAADFIVRLARIGHRVLILDYENHPGEWSRRVGSLGGADALHSTTWVAPLTAEWTERRGPLWAAQDDVRVIADAVDATYIVVDSIVPACVGVDPAKPEAAAQYAAAIEFIGRPMLSLGHATKADNLSYPFGSVFWHNFARVTWSLEPDGDSKILTCRKHNNYAGVGRVVVTSTWIDGRPGEVWERSYAAVLGERISEVLTASPGLTVAAIVDLLNDEDDSDGARVKPDSVRKTLRRGITSTPKRYTVRGGGATAEWTVA